MLCLVAASLVQAGEPAPDPTRAGMAAFTAAYQAWDASRFAGAAQLFREATTRAPASSTNFYWLGAAEFHHLLGLRSLPATDSNQLAAAAAMDAALAALGTAVKLDARQAESHAMLGTLYGMKIGGNLLRAARFGPRVAKHGKRALEFGSQNPRVVYLLGTCQFHTATTPAARREALASFLAAEKLFVAEAQRPPGPYEPRWGLSACRTFIGRTCELLGQRTEAADYFRKALAEHPADHLAREGLERVTKEP